jgi:glycerate 2-kinase
VSATTAKAESRDATATEVLLAPIGNASRLLDHGLIGLRRVALEVAATGLRAADPALAVDRLVHIEGQTLRAGGRNFDVGTARSIVLLGAGKASLRIAEALERKLGERITRGLVVGRQGTQHSLSRVEVIEADHPVPGEASVAAARRLVEIADDLDEDNLVITAFTGGSSALACLPPDGVPFEAKRQLHSLLLDSGMPIAEINTVRKHVSAIKGGRLGARLGGAAVLNLTVSDVVGDAVDLLCDPVVQDTTGGADAVTVLKRHGLWDAVAPEVKRHLLSPLAESPSLRGADITTVVLVTGAAVVNQMAERARSLGHEPVILGSSIEGEASGIGAFLGALAAESASHGRPFMPGSVVLAAGGEATVSIQRSSVALAGHGGPNQEMALAFARVAARNPTAQVAGVFLDSDGSDGGTDAAGGCVDSTSAASAATFRLSLDDGLAEHNSSEALSVLGDLVMTGPTGTNISDVWVVAIGAGEAGDVEAPAGTT